MWNDFSVFFFKKWSVHVLCTGCVASIFSTVSSSWLPHFSWLTVLDVRQLFFPPFRCWTINFLSFVNYNCVARPCFLCIAQWSWTSWRKRWCWLELLNLPREQKKCIVIFHLSPSTQVKFTLNGSNRRSLLLHYFGESEQILYNGIL